MLHRSGFFSRLLLLLCASLLLLELPASHGLAHPRERAQRKPGFRIAPYLQVHSANEMHVLFETRRPRKAVVYFGTDPASMDSVVAGDSLRSLHDVALRGLQAETVYFYQVEIRKANGKARRAARRQFITPPAPEKAEAGFVVGLVSDTQHNPRVWGRIAKQLYRERPNLCLHAGDIVGNGRRKRQWVRHFLRPGSVLMSRVPTMLAMGNHDKNHQHYFDYTSNPNQGRDYYSFRYGGAEFFFLNTHKPQQVMPDRVQHSWLDSALGASTAAWKIVVHHHPPYSSDENDFGDTYQGPSPRGDRRLQGLVKLYEQHGVDLVMYGHIHDYERTFPLLQDQVDPNGVVYLLMGGGGGHLENYAPSASWFKAKVKRAHSYGLLQVSGSALRLQALDQHGRLFDTWEKRK